MKRFILLIFALLPLAAMAQSPAFTELMSRYSSMQGCTTVRVSCGMLQVMNIEAEIDNMLVISVENSDLTAQFKTEFMQVVASHEQMMAVESEGQTVMIYDLADESGAIYELVIFTAQDNECVAVCITGDDIELSEVGSLMNF